MKWFGLNRWFLKSFFVLGVLGVAQSSSADFFLNEIFINPPGSDDGFEFFEIRSASGGAASMQNLWFLSIEGDGAAAGVVDQAINLSSFSTGTNGLFLWRDAAGLLNPNPDSRTVVNVADFNPDIENGSNTFLLVRSFTGAVNDDLDLTNSGTLNTTRWSSVVDAVSLIENDTTNSNIGYAASLGGVNVGAFTNPTTGFNPDFLARDSVSNAWIAADVLGTGSGPFNVDASRFSHASGFTAADLNFQNLSPGSANFTAVPEPGSMLLLGCFGIVGGAWRRLRKIKA